MKQIAYFYHIFKTFIVARDASFFSHISLSTFSRNIFMEDDVLHTSQIVCKKIYQSPSQQGPWVEGMSSLDFCVPVCQNSGTCSLRHIRAPSDTSGRFACLTSK